MNIAGVHALLILAMPVATAMLLVLGGLRCPKSWVQILMPPIVAALVWFCIGIVTVAATPWYPDGALIVGVSCVLVSLLAVNKPAWRYGGAVAIVIATGALVVHAWTITGAQHVPRFCRMYRQPYGFDHNAKSVVSSTSDLIRDAARNGDSKQYAEGWIEDSVSVPDIPDVVRGLERWPIPKLAWHSWLTGIADSEPDMRLGVWFPGGTLADAASRLTVKPRPQQRTLQH